MASLLTVPLSFLALQARSSLRSISFSRSEALMGSSLNLATSVSPTAAPPTFPLVYCGRGDKKTAKGKRFKHSFGNARPRNKNKGRGPPRIPAPPSAPRKNRFDDNEKVKIVIEESLFS